MSTGQAAIWALVVACVSVILLILTRGVPTVQQASRAGLEFAAVAFVVLRFFVPKKSGGNTDDTL